jgi:hypothetical protein
MADKATLWTVKLTEPDIRTMMRVLDYTIDRAENTEATKFVIDRLCRQECVVQWKRIQAELFSIVGDEDA